jgi:dGTPase
LRLNEDLTEAIALAHDIGHPPFGHAGEDALDEALRDHGGFDHNANTLRALMRLESPYPGHEGLNLTWEVLEGLAKHNGPVAEPNWALAELDAAFPLALRDWPSLEAQVAAVADDIAYDNHDIDDGLRAGFLALDDLLGLDFVADQWRSVEKRFPSAPRERQLRELVRDQIGLMVNDVIATTRGNVRGISSIENVRAAGRALAGFSPDMASRERGLKRLMYDRLYFHPDQVATAARAREVVAALFAAYSGEPRHLPEGWRAGLPAAEPARGRHVADFIAGMSDRYAIREYQRIFGRAPEGLSNV